MIAKNVQTYRIVDNILGWLMFAIAATTYVLTIEPSASFWDCPEFILAGYKLEIGHPPGAPFFILTANLFSQFANNPTQVAWCINLMNALLSALCILFLFWTITNLVRRLLISSWNELSIEKWVAIEMSGVMGALIYTFSDTFWYSAVEGEVYAFSSLLTAVVFWLILKWDEEADLPHSDRWLVLIAYIIGLSIGVHLLNLLCLSALVLVFYYRRFSKTDLKGSLVALLVSFLLIAVILYAIIPGVITVAGWFELLFVNVLHCGYNTGLYVYLILLIPLVCWALWITYRHKMRIAHTALLCLTMLLIGYSSYALILIRSTANTPMDQNSPEDVFSLRRYLARDQYGHYPLLYGQAYTSQVKLEQKDNYCIPAQKKGKAEYRRKPKTKGNERDEYFVAANDMSYVYEQNMLFPRMWDSKHANDYESWMGGISGRNVPYNRCGEPTSVKMPTQWENLRFFLSYQCNFMYWRYFMWNFAGRQNDIQGNGEPEHGNWISGIALLDNWRLGNQDLLPDELQQNKGHNVFYCLPLLLGIIGILWQSLRKGERGIRQFWVVFFLFFMTGLAIVIYINQTPVQPRERDYSYAGSFYAFAIWCGMGVAAIHDMMSNMFAKMTSPMNTKGAIMTVSIISLLTLLIPIQMGTQTWDDHDRSSRYICHDAGYNYLNSAQLSNNPIILSNGDNDTFPLWYCQEVEGIRTDMRVCNIMYATTDWYIDQLCRPAYEAPGVPIHWHRSEYITGVNDYVEIVPEAKQQLLDYYQSHPQQAHEQFGTEPFELGNIIKYWVRSADANMHIIPTDTIYINIDREAVLKSGMMVTDTIPNRMEISLKGRRFLMKSDLMLLEMLKECNWERPIYICNSVGDESYLNLSDYLTTEGIADRITPFKNQTAKNKHIDTERTYENLMHRFRFTGIDKPNIYLDEPNMSMCYRYRRLFAQLALALIAEQKTSRAKEVLQKAAKVIPYYNVPADYLYGSDNDIALAYSLLGMKKEAANIISMLWRKSTQYLRWYLSQDPQRLATSKQECSKHFFFMQQIVQTASMINDSWAEKLINEMEKYYQQYQRIHS